MTEEYRVMHLGGAYQIQQRFGKSWKTIGEMNDLSSAKALLEDLRNEEFE